MSTSLFALGMLARHGEMHGHQLRRTAELERLEWWGEVRVGALYGTIHRLQAEGLVEAVRVERSGKFPARTVYAITNEGRRELTVLRRNAFRNAEIRPDPVDLALSLADDVPEQTLLAVVDKRIAELLHLT